VTVLEQENAPGMRTSFANAGRFCPTAMAFYPLSSPAIISRVLELPLHALKNFVLRFGSMSDADETYQLVKGDMPSSIQWSYSLTLWGMVFMRNCTQSRYDKNNCLIRQLMNVSAEATNCIMDAIPGNGRSKVQWHQGNLTIDDSQTFDPNRVPGLVKAGYQASQTYTCDECISTFPFLGSYLSQMKKATMNPMCTLTADDASADARLFLLEVSKLCENDKNPVRFKYNTRVVDVALDGRKVDHVVLEGKEEELRADFFVFCCGPWTQSIMSQFFHSNLFIECVRGCSLDLTGVQNGPSVAIVDKVSGALSFQVTPFHENRVRLIGMADFVKLPVSSSLECPDGCEETLLSRAQMMLPSMTYTSKEAVWCGMRPQTPDSLPVVGKVEQFDNVFVNAGHGSTGWTLASGTAALLCCNIIQEDPDASIHNRSQAASLFHRFEVHMKDISVSRFSWWNIIFS